MAKHFSVQLTYLFLLLQATNLQIAMRLYPPTDTDADKTVQNELRLTKVASNNDVKILHAAPDYHS